VLKGSPLVTYLVLVEPADEHRQGFARWCLAQDPPIMTASSSGSEVPADLFATIPDELLDGARVDGTVFRPVVEGFAPGPGDTYTPEQIEQAPAKRTQPKPRGRRTTRKADSQ
jgi:hypothetical protein